MGMTSNPVFDRSGSVRASKGHPSRPLQPKPAPQVLDCGEVYDNQSGGMMQQDVYGSEPAAMLSSAVPQPTYDLGAPAQPVYDTGSAPQGAPVYDVGSDAPVYDTGSAASADASFYDLGSAQQGRGAVATQPSYDMASPGGA